MSNTRHNVRKLPDPAPARCSVCRHEIEIHQDGKCKLCIILGYSTCRVKGMP
jgi:hypothetical protein